MILQWGHFNANLNSVDIPNDSGQAAFNQWPLHMVSNSLPLNFTGDMAWFPAFAFPGWLGSPHICHPTATKNSIRVYGVKVNSYVWEYWWCAIGW